MRARWIQAGLIGVLGGLLAACPANNNCDPGACRDVTVGDARVDGARDVTPVDTGDPSQREIVALTITPENPTLTVTDATPATQVFHAMGTRRDGMSVAVAATFSVPDLHLGSMASDGTFTANGIAGGQVQVTAQAPGPGGTSLMVSTTLTVRLVRVIAGAGVTPEQIAMFGTSPAAMDTAAEANLLYPLNNAFMPNNVAPPDVQWERGDPGDVFRILLAKPNASITAYVVGGPGFAFDWAVSPEAWRAILESDPDANATLSVDRLQISMARVVTGTSIHLRFAHGSIFGVVYYWDLNSGRMRRIDAVSAMSANLIPSPPPNPADPANRCVACHAISQNGRYLSAELWGGAERSTVFDLTADLSVDPAPTVFPTNVVSYLFSSFSPDATRLVTNQGNAFGMIDPSTGASVAATGLPGAQASHPAWSPDGNNIAFITNTNGGWAVDYTNGDLALLPRTGPDAFGAPVVLHTGASLASAPEGGSTDSHPTWSPDSRFVAFGHSTHSRSDGGGGRDVPGALWVIGATAGSTPVRLDQAVGPGTPQSYWPTFSPFVTSEPGGEHLFWLAFISRRDYGNAQAGTRGSTRRQIWVTAVTASGTTDPSHVPYWLPGQNAAVQNMAAQWAPLPCRVNATTCAVSSECCSGLCDPGTHTCQPMSTCRNAGQTCGGNDDCCTGLMCIGNVCAVPPG